MSKTSAVAGASDDKDRSVGGFRVSKHIIPSKQSSNPSLLSTLAAWTLSAFVKIYFTVPKIHASDYSKS